MGLGTGRIPNPDLDRRERHYKFTKIPADPNTAEPPELQHEHTERGQRQWARWWSTPMSRMWGPFDSDALERLLLMYEGYWAGEQVPFAEIRQLEDRYGLTPASRARLCWQVEGIDIPSVKPERLGNEPVEGTRPKAGGKADPRRLRAV